MSAPVWTRLPGLPLKFWNEEVFKGIASSFGELLSIDPMTAKKSRLVFARICVNFNQMTDMPQSIEIISKLGKWTQVIEYESLPFACFNCKNLGHWAKSCLLKKSNSGKSDISSKKKWQTKGKREDPPAECVPDKEVIELENEDKKDMRSNNEKSVCAFSNNQIESIKEEEQRIEANAQKSDSEVQKGGLVGQDKVEESSNDDASASSNTKANGGDFNEAQDYNISDFEPLLLLTNGSPKLSQCKTPSNSLEMVNLEENLRILSTKEGKSNNGGPNGGISTRSKNKKMADVGSHNKKQGRPSLKN